jgi:hypothetical protein
LALHQNQRGEIEKGVLTGDELRTVENGDVDEGNRHENREELPGSVLQLQMKKEHMRSHPDQATSDELRGGKLSPVHHGWRHRDPRWRPDEWSLSCKNQGKSSVRSRRNSMHKESMNGGWSRRLASGEHDGGLPHDGEKWGEGGKSFDHRLLL